MDLCSVPDAGRRSIQGSLLATVWRDPGPHRCEGWAGLSLGGHRRKPCPDPAGFVRSAGGVVSWFLLVAVILSDFI